MLADGLRPDAQDNRDLLIGTAACYEVEHRQLPKGQVIRTNPADNCPFGLALDVLTEGLEFFRYPPSFRYILADHKQDVLAVDVLGHTDTLLDPNNPAVLAHLAELDVMLDTAMPDQGKQLAPDAGLVL